MKTFITIKQLAELAHELKVYPSILELKLQSCNIYIQKQESTGFRCSRKQKYHTY